MTTFEAIEADFGEGNGRRVRLRSPLSGLKRERVIPEITKAEIAAGFTKVESNTATKESSARIVTKYSETAPAREPCAEGRHYACGSKECSCACHKEETKSTRKQHHLLAVVLLLAVGIAISLLCFKATRLGVQLAVQLSKPAVHFATFIFVDDIEGALLNQQSMIVGVPGESALRWAELDRQTTAGEYEAAYDDNEIAADNQYKGKKILVSGTVARIEKDFTGKGDIWFHGSGLLGIHAQLTNRGTVEAAAFTRGQHVNLVCNGSGRLLTVANLDNCEALSDYMKDLPPSVESKITGFLNGRTVLRRGIAKWIALMYVIGLSLPADSPCMNDNADKCPSELAAIFKDKAKAHAVEAQAEKMVNSLKVD